MEYMLIDIGNTNSKVARYNGVLYEVLYVGVDFNIAAIKALESVYRFDKVAMCVVGSVEDSVYDYLKSNYSDFLKVDYRTPMPIENLYGTPKTLGMDRIVAAVGARALASRDNLLIFDCGSAITIDFVNSKNQFLGGNISPGIGLRFKSLNQFTKNLPMVDICNSSSLTGNNTNEAIAYGVVNSVLFEIKGYIKEYKNKYSDIDIIFTGGDSVYISTLIEEECLVYSELVFNGLKILLDYNAKK